MLLQDKMMHAYNPNCWGCGARGIIAEATLSKRMRPYLKNKLEAKDSGMAQVVEHMRCCVQLPLTAKKSFL
jgi:hypothetical protein